MRPLFNFKCFIYNLHVVHQEYPNENLYTIILEISILCGRKQQKMWNNFGDGISTMANFYGNKINTSLQLLFTVKNWMLE